MSKIPSRLAGLGRRSAEVVLALSAAALAWCGYVAATQPILSTASAGGEPRRRGTPDSVFYYDIVDRVRAGQGYYAAVQSEFALPVWSRDFRPSSLFNWRTPVYAWLLAALPGEVGGIAAATLLALATAALCFHALRQTQGPAAAFLTVLLIGPLAWCFLADAYLFTELWAGMLIALSIAAYALGRWPLGLLAALAALFFRELVLPYCGLCLLLSLGQQRRRETAAWLGGLALFAVFYAWHIAQIRHQLAGSAGTGVGAWMRFAGTPFVLATVQLGNVFLTALPALVSAVVLPLALLGLAGWRGDRTGRGLLTAAGYLAFFAIAGRRPNNAYWGLLIGPLLMLGLAALPGALADLRKALSGVETV